MSGARLLIDADACPVVEIALREAKARGVEVLLVCDDAHEMRREGARTVTVARGANSADLRLVNLLKPGDIVVTQDYGLAALPACWTRTAASMTKATSMRCWACAIWQLKPAVRAAV